MAHTKPTAEPAHGPSVRVETERSESAAVKSAATLDLAILRDLVGDNAHVIQEILSEYLASSRQQATDLLAARRAGDLRRVGAIAHQLKSSSRLVGALAFGDLCAELEGGCRAGIQDDIDHAMANFEAESARACAGVASALDDLIGGRESRQATG